MSTHFHPIVMLLLVFGAIGFVVRLLADPVSVLLVLGLSVALFYVINHYLKTGHFLPQIGTPAPGAKRSAKPTRTAGKKPGGTPRKRIPFQVIEGSKGKEKPKEKEPKIYH